jgi:hypothetical protein
VSEQRFKTRARRSKKSTDSADRYIYVYQPTEFGVSFASLGFVTPMYSDSTLPEPAAPRLRQSYGASPSVSSIRVPQGSVKNAMWTFAELLAAR